MSTIVETAPVWTAVEIAQRFGAIPMSRIGSDPPPGQATEEDVDRWEQRLVSHRLS